MMPNEVKEIECLRCCSVLFSIDSIVKHIRDNPSHKWFKFEEKGVIFIKQQKSLNPLKKQDFIFPTSKGRESPRNGTILAHQKVIGNSISGS